jgi:predicted kinase
MTSRSPVVILLFGLSGVGKSTIARSLAAGMERCAHIEVDALRYLVVGGLVACSAGRRPMDDPEGYREQCWMGVDQAVRLAHGFAARGFSSVIEGLEDECLTDRDWVPRAFPGLGTRTVLLSCDRAVLAQRWSERGWTSTLSADFVERARTLRGLCDDSIDTTHGTSDDNASGLSRQLRGER